VRRRTGVIVGLAFAIGGWACLPFSRSFTTSPPIVGMYRAETGEPLGGVQLAISTEPGDSLCASPALQTATDSAGAFYFPAGEGHDAVVILAPIDRELTYTFCARVAGTMGFVFAESSEINRSFRTKPDSLTCIEFRTPGKSPVVCTKRR
jgi:hypothetical protein